MNEAEWWDEIYEGVVLIVDDRVVGINAAAARLLGVDPAWAAEKQLPLVLRDNRLERVWHDGRSTEVVLAERNVVVERLSAGLLLRDVTEERRAATTARELLAVISHELRTPMTTVTSTLEALAYGDLEESQVTRFLQRARLESERVVRLLGDLTVSVDPPRERTVDLGEVVARADSLLRVTVGDERAELRAAVSGVLAWSDPDKLLQVLLNLIENATLHGPEGGPVEIAVVERDGWLELQVSDLGEPLPNEIVERLFTPYSGSGRGRGRGLGLYVVRTIVERWGGRAWYSRWQDEENRCGNRFHALVRAHRNGGEAASQRQ